MIDFASIEGSHRVDARSALSRRIGSGMAEDDGGDDVLRAALRAQDPAVAGPLWRRFAPTISRLLRRVLGPRAAIDDAVQVVLMCVFHRGQRLRPRADLRRLVVKTTADIARAELRRPRIGVSSSAPSTRFARETRRDVGSEAVLRFYRTLDRLGAADRIAFVFRHIEGIDARAVAAAIGESPATTKRRIDRALGKVVVAIGRDPVLRRLRTGSTP